MIILLAALSASANLAPAHKVSERIRVSATIIRGAEVSLRSWKLGMSPAQREVLKKEKDGRTILLRLNEFE